MKNILFSTTRQWNPGDEFILLGTINLLKEVFGEFNPIIFNRNPDIRQSYQFLNPLRKSFFSLISFKGKSFLETFFRIGFWDNSFKDDMDLKNINLVVFAGSPEWFGKVLKPLYKRLTQEKIPVVFLGIGAGKNFEYSSISGLYKDVIEQSRLITVRDTYTFEALSSYVKAYFLPCPALFSVPFEKEISSVNKIGLIYATHRSAINNRVKKSTHEFLIQLYKKLMGKFDCELICHYIDEINDVYLYFPETKVHYSYDSKDYINIYKKFDLVVGPRVHGIGMAASLGIPGILIAHDIRGNTGQGFLSDIVQVENINIDMFMELLLYKVKKIKQQNENLIAYKHIKKKEYLDLLNNVLK